MEWTFHILSPMPPGRPKAFETDDALDRALDVFWDKGFEQTSIADLVEATGVGRQSLYDTFGDKRALYLASIERYATRAGERVIAVLDGPPPKIERVREVLRAWANDGRSPACKGCLVGNSLAEFGGRDPELSAMLARHTETMEIAFADALAQAAREGDVRTDIDPRSLARVLINAARGLSLAGKGQLGGDRVTDIAQTLERLIV